MSNTATAEQIEAMLDFLASHRDLARGLVNSVEGRVHSKRLWDSLALQLNSLGGAIKTVQQWKKVWADRKYLAKKANAAAHRSAAGTGGGPPTANILSQNDHKVIEIMGEGFGEPDISNCRAPAFPQVAVQSSAEDLLPSAQPSPAPDSPRLDNPLVDSSNILIQSPGKKCQISCSLPLLVKQELPLCQLQGRFGEGHMQCSLRLRLENEKKDVLMGILDELKTLNATLKNIFEKI